MRPCVFLLRGSQLHPERADLTYNLAVAQLRTHQPAEAIKTLTPLSNSNDSDLLKPFGPQLTFKQISPTTLFRVLEKAIELKNQRIRQTISTLAILLPRAQPGKQVCQSSPPQESHESQRPHLFISFEVSPMHS